jgi:hypothetical protein
MNGRCGAVWIVTTVGLLLFGGCNGTPGESAQSSPELKKLQASLEEARQQKTQLQGDV